MKTKLRLLTHQLPIGKRDLRPGSSLRALAIRSAIGCLATSLATASIRSAICKPTVSKKPNPAQRAIF
jgi:hypothetical protein